MLNIAVWHHLPSGGAKRALYEHVQGLHARGHALEAWCPPTADREFLPLSTVIPEQQLPLGPSTLPRMARWFLRYAGGEPLPLERLKAMTPHAARFTEIVNGGGYDVLFAASCRWFHAPPVARRIRIPSVLYLQEPCRPLYEAMPVLPWLAEDDVASDWRSGQPLRHWIGSALRIHPLRVQAREELRNVKAFDLVLVNSRFSRESVLRAYGVDANVCYLGIDVQQFANSSAERLPFVLSVGSLDSHKNPEFVIRAIGLSQTKPTLVWAANAVNAACRESAQRLAAQLGVTLNVRENLTDDQLIELYQSAAVLAYAPRLEPFGYAPLEANSCGTPVVALAEGGVRETVVDNENGLLVDAEPQMAGAIDWLLTHSHRAREIGQHGARVVRHRWTLDAAVQRLEAQLRAVARERIQEPRSLTA